MAVTTAQNTLKLQGSNMSQNDDLIAEIAAQIPPKRGRGRPRKEKRKKPSMGNKRVRRANSTDFDVTTAAHVLHAAAGYLNEKLIESDLALHFDFRTSLTLLIQRIQKTAVGLSLHLSVPNKEAFKNEALTAIEYEKALSYRKTQIAKQLAQSPSGKSKEKIHFD